MPEVPVPEPIEVSVGGQLGLNAALMGAFGWLDWEVAESFLVTDYCERSQDRLIEQFKDKERIKDYLCALVGSLQTLEYTFGDLLTLRTLDNSTGVQLDGLGDIVGLERNGLTDEPYRQAIRFQVGINFSNGEHETLISLTKFITGGTTVNIKPAHPAGVSILTNGSQVSGFTVPILEESAAAGVEIELVSTYGSLNPFAFEIEPGDIDPEPQGFSEPNYAPDDGLGGELAEKFI